MLDGIHPDCGSGDYTCDRIVRSRRVSRTMAAICSRCQVLSKARFRPSPPPVRDSLDPEPVFLAAPQTCFTPLLPAGLSRRTDLTRRLLPRCTRLPNAPELVRLGRRRIPTSATRGNIRNKRMRKRRFNRASDSLWYCSVNKRPAQNFKFPHRGRVSVYPSGVPSSLPIKIRNPYREHL
jgi:hypothetical protein